MKHYFLLSVTMMTVVTHAQTYYGNGYTIVEGVESTSMDLDTRVFKSISAYTVGEGLQQLLDGSGWALARTENADPALWRLFQQPYPEFKRTLNPMKLGHALQYLAGDAWDLVVDPVNRLISFEVNERYLTQIKPLPIVEPDPTPIAPAASTYAPPPVVYNDPPKTPTLAERRMASALSEAGRAKSKAPPTEATQTTVTKTESGYDMGTFLENVQKPRGRK